MTIPNPRCPRSLSTRAGASLLALACVLAGPGAFAQSVAPAAPAPSPAVASPARPASHSLDRVVAVVNDEVLTQTELDYRVRLAEAQLARQRISPPAQDVLRKQILERMILDRAQVQQARENGVRVDDATVNASIGRMAEQNTLTPQAMREKIEADGVPFAQFREDMRDEITMMRLRDHEVDGKIQVSEGEIDNFLAEQGKASANATEYQISQILIGVPEIASPEYVERARQRAEGIMEQIRQGGDFARLAAGYSASPEALQGGDLGWRTLERMPALFAETVRKLSAGQVGPLVRSPVGFHILKLVGVRDTSNVRLTNKAVAQTRARHILLRVTDVMPEAEVRHRLDDLRERIRGGQDFSQLARLYSVDPSSTRGGDLGWLYSGDTVPPFEAAMNALAVNEISAPVQSPFGWHLIQVLERRNEESSIERKRMEARQAIRERKSEEALQEWLRQLRDRTYVEYHLDDLR
jgi:peptidyl-prolyl cis-trans isomerase SurA